MSESANLAGECHDTKIKHESGENEATESGKNRISGFVFRNAFRMVGIIISDYLASQFPFAGKRLTAVVMVGLAVDRVLIGRKIHTLPT